MSEVNVGDRLPQVMTGHIQTAAYAGECRLCPPPLFLILVSFLQIGFFVHQVLKLAWFNSSLSQNPFDWFLFLEHIELVPFLRARSTGPFLRAHLTVPF